MVKAAGQQTRSEAVHDSIRADILSGRLRPGQRLKFPELSEHYGVSTGAVREALLKLVAKNLVTSEAHHGFQVTDVTPQGLANLTDARTEIESLALRRAISEGDLAWQAKVLAAHHTFEQTPHGEGDQPTEAWLIAHADFHTALLAGCANPRLRDLAASLREEAELYRRWSRPAPTDPDADAPAPDAHRQPAQSAPDEHRTLLAAVLARNPAQADAALRTLITSTATMLLTPDPDPDTDPDPPAL